jgi:hypothetical protein
MAANRDAVDHLDVAVVGSSDGIYHPIPDTCVPPSHEAIVSGGTWPVAFGQVAPRRASQRPEDAVQHAAIIDTRCA